MNESDMEYIRRIFADLTGVLEDATAMAPKGQFRQLTTEAAERIIQSIEKAMADDGNLLNNINHRTGR